MKLNNLSKIDKKELLQEVKSMNFSFRPSLNFSKNITYGIEIEYIDAPKNKIMKKIENIKGAKDIKFYKKWSYSFDPFIAIVDDYKFYGGEIKSPVLINKKKYFNDIKMVCEILKKYNAKVNEMTGFHIHIGNDVLKSKLNRLENFIKLYSYYEDIIFKFGFYGEKPRRVVNVYSSSVSYNLYNILETKNYDSYDELFELCFYLFMKDAAINYNYELNTFEFRNCNGTIDPVIIQNNINLFCSLMDACKEDIDFEKIDYNLEKFSDVNYVLDENNIGITKALEFADIVFKDDLDKKYFLKQYMM